MDCTGTFAGGTLSGSLDDQLMHPIYGGYTGTMDVTAYNPMDVKAFMSPDKNFVAMFAWDNSVTPSAMEDYILIGIEK